MPSTPTPTPSATKPQDEPPVERWVEAIPFLFGGALAVYFGFSLHAAPTRSGSVPYWVLAFALGIIALVAGVLLLLASPGDETEDDADDEEGKIAVPRKEWERGTTELDRLKGGTGQRGPANEEKQVARARRPHGTGPEGTDDAVVD